MGRNRFVQPDVVRLSLADVHRRSHDDLVKLGKKNDKGEYVKATPEDLADSAARVSAADADGDFIDVKRELTAGESRRVFSRIVKEMRAGEHVTLDPELVGLTRILEYLLGWSFVDADGKPVKITPDAVNGLDADTYAEITTALDQHVEREDQVRAARKKSRGGENGSSAISPSAGS